MANLNKVMLIGRLTRDVTTKNLQSGTTVGEFGLAINRVWNQNGEKKEEVTFVDVTVWEKSAETLERYVKKGDHLFVEGRLKFDTWEDKEGNKRSKLSVVCDRFQFLPSGQKDAQGSGGGQSRDNIEPGDFGVGAGSTVGDPALTDDVPF